MSSSIKKVNQYREVFNLIANFVRQYNCVPPNSFVMKKLDLTYYQVRYAFNIIEKKGMLEKYKYLPKLTTSQCNILITIKEYIDKNGYPPIIREIMEIEGYSSTQTVFGILERLKEKKIIGKGRFLVKAEQNL